MRRQQSLRQLLLKATRAASMRHLADATKLIQRTLLNPLASPDFKPLMDPLRRVKAKPNTTKESPNTVTFPPHASSKVSAESRQHKAFTASTFIFNGEPYPYRLYIPALPLPPTGTAVAQNTMPLVVLLHGCKQDAQDFARGTAMNTLADARGCMVLYPEQTSKSNAHRCWNWFDPDHQQRDEGEPGMIAALTQQIMTHDYNGRHVDPSRVYIAGLSAGGAMAAVVAGLYPHLFAAVGVHSGLPAGAAQDLMSAFGAMRHGSKGLATAPMPTIVFHGSADRTVHPDNGEYISDAALAALKADGLPLIKSHSHTNAKAQEDSTEKVIYRLADGPSYVEHWRIHAGPHAWSGGDATGSYTDPAGPSASAAMLSFFLQHQLKS